MLMRSPLIAAKSLFSLKIPPVPVRLFITSVLKGAAGGSMKVIWALGETSKVFNVELAVIFQVLVPSTERFTVCGGKLTIGSAGLIPAAPVNWFSFTAPVRVVLFCKATLVVLPASDKISPFRVDELAVRLTSELKGVWLRATGTVT